MDGSWITRKQELGRTGGSTTVSLPVCRRYTRGPPLLRVQPASERQRRQRVGCISRGRTVYFSVSHIQKGDQRREWRSGRSRNLQRPAFSPSIQFSCWRC